jgi:hypothetical protein
VTTRESGPQPLGDDTDSGDATAPKKTSSSKKTGKKKKKVSSSDLAIWRFLELLLRLPRQCPMWKRSVRSSRRHTYYLGAGGGADTMRTLMPDGWEVHVVGSHQGHGTALLRYLAPASLHQDGTWLQTRHGAGDSSNCTCTCTSTSIQLAVSVMR